MIVVQFALIHKCVEREDKIAELELGDGRDRDICCRRYNGGISKVEDVSYIERACIAVWRYIDRNAVSAAVEGRCGGAGYIDGGDNGCRCTGFRCNYDGNARRCCDTAAMLDRIAERIKTAEGGGRCIADRPAVAVKCCRAVCRFGHFRDGQPTDGCPVIGQRTNHHNFTL